MSPGTKKALIVTVKAILTVLVFWWLFTKSGINLGELLAEVKAIDPARFVPWLILAVAVKLVGIFANIRRWQLLLHGQDLLLPFRYLTGSFFVGRFFGIVTPGTLGLDGFKLYDTIRATRKPVECAAVIFIDKVIGLVSLIALLAVVFPLGWKLIPNLDANKAIIVFVGMLIASAGFFGVLLAPALTRPFLKLVPTAKLKGFATRVFDATTAYSGHRSKLVQAVALAVVGHFTTALMYWGILMGISAGAPDVGLVLFSALLMTSATLVGPTVGGEGIREFVFVKLLEGMVPSTRAFLFGHIGFWIEKGLLGIPGGVIYALRKEAWTGPVTKADLEKLSAEAIAEGASTPEPAGA
jgi:glycosyltransferase 2 family protein